MSLKYPLLTRRGAVSDAAPETASPVNDPLANFLPSPDVLALMPAAVARENLVIPLALHHDRLTCAAVNADDVMLADKLRFIVNRDIHLVPAPLASVLQALNRYYPDTHGEVVGMDLEAPGDYAGIAKGGILYNVPPAPAASPPVRRPAVVKNRLMPRGRDDEDEEYELSLGDDTTPNMGGSGVFFYVVEEGQRVLMRRRDGTMEVVVGPKRIWKGWKTFTAMSHHIAHPGEFLIVRYRDGRQEHLPGPADVWFDPRIHQKIEVQDALQLAAKEAVVVYSKPVDGRTIARRIEYGPCLFVPQPGEWLHTFSWHGSKGGHKGVQKEPNSLVFQKLWLMPDQMYHDVSDVRTADDALLTVRLMIFYELVDIERMLETTHDPIGDFVNATTSDVVEFVGRHDFESFKRNTHHLNEMETYSQLRSRGEQGGYRITKVVYRGYGAPESLQQMHDQAIEARTRLQLDRATEQQAQDLENYKLDCQIARAGKRRTEQATEVGHELEMTRQRQEAELRQREAQQTSAREQARQQAEMQQEVRRRSDAQQRDHLAVLRDMGVDLTAYLTQNRADKVIELRGGAKPHLHIDQDNGAK
jgi:hypothetical protein